MEIKAGNHMRGGVTSLPVTPGGTSKHLAGKPETTGQWNTRPRTVVNRYMGGDKTDG